MGPLEMVQVKKGGAALAHDADQVSISANGRYVTYTSRNTNVVGIPPRGSKTDHVFRYDLKTGKTVLVSVTPDGQPGNDDSDQSVISGDGSVVVFETRAEDLLPGTPPLTVGVVVARDLETGETTLVSRTPAGEPPIGSSFDPLVSEDGSLVSFTTQANDITGKPGAVVFDRTTDTSTAVTVETSSGTLIVHQVSISGNGEWLTFTHTNSRIVPGDDNGAPDVFLMNLASGEVTLVSRSADGTVANAQSRHTVAITSLASPKPFTSADGSTVVFWSDATDLAGAEGPNGDYIQAYAFDVSTGLNELVTVMPNGSPSDDVGYAVTISPDGRYAAITTQAFLAGGDGPGVPMAFVRDLARGKTRAVSGIASGFGPGLGGRRPHVVFVTSDDLVPEDTDFNYDPYHRRAW